MQLFASKMLVARGLILEGLVPKELTVLLMKVLTLPVTRGGSISQTSLLMTGYQEGIQLVKTGGREVFVVKSEQF